MKKIFFIMFMFYSSIAMSVTINLHYCVYFMHETLESHNYFFNYGAVWYGLSSSSPKKFTLAVPSKTRGYYCSGIEASFKYEYALGNYGIATISVYGDNGAEGGFGGVVDLNTRMQSGTDIENIFAINRTSVVVICQNKLLCHRKSGDYEVAETVGRDEELYVILFPQNRV